MSMVRVQAKVQFEAGIFKMTVSFGGVARKRYPFPKWDNDPLFMQVASFKIHGVNEEIARVTKVGDGGGEETLGRENGVIIPAFDAETLQGREGVEAGRFEVAIEDGLARPADLGKFAISLKQGTGLGEFGLHGYSRGSIFYDTRMTRVRPMGLDDFPATFTLSIHFCAIPTGLFIACIGGVVEGKHG